MAAPAIPLPVVLSQHRSQVTQSFSKQTFPLQWMPRKGWAGQLCVTLLQPLQLLRVASPELLLDQQAVLQPSRQLSKKQEKR